MIKQNGTLNNVLIGGEPSKVYNIWLSLFNWGALNEELRDLGSPDVFQYFNIDKDRYIHYRAKALSNAWLHFNDRWMGNKTKGNVHKVAKQTAIKELESYKEEKFLMGRDLEFEELSVDGMLD